MEDRRRFIGLAAAGAATAVFIPGAASAKSMASLDAEANAALAKLVSENAAAAALSRKAKATLVFPNIVKAGLVFGGAYGKGVLKQGGKVVAHYQTAAGSFGFQAGAQSYGYAMFLMSQSAVDYLHDSKGWEIGAGPTVVVVDEGVAAEISSSTIKNDAYAFVFNQQGLMAGISLNGSKISKMK